MKRIILSALLVTAIGASEYNYEISPMVGYAFPNHGQDLKNHGVLGIEAQYNNLKTVIKPELSILFSHAEYKNSTMDSDIFRSTLNGVYEFQQSDNIIPFVKAGVGYETMHEHQYENHDSPFVDAGAGIKVALTNQIALKLEAIEMFKHNNNEWDNNLLFMAGLNFAFGAKAQPVIPVVEAQKVLQPHSEPLPKSEPEHAEIVPMVVTAILIPVAPIDSDQDGVYDDFDKCPNTPSRFEVDKNGCPIKATLHLHFETDSNKIDSTGTSEVSEYSQFLKENPQYKVTIVGYTDATGTEEHNQKLSERRAEIVKNTLIQQGVDANRLTSLGEGEKSPIATNSTKEGRLENRRIEIELCQ